jgi:hypothetical protein
VWREGSRIRQIRLRERTRVRVVEGSNLAGAMFKLMDEVFGAGRDFTRRAGSSSFPKILLFSCYHPFNRTPAWIDSL